MSYTLTYTIRLDFDLLRQQKAVLLGLLDKSQKPSDEAYLLDGVVHMIDSIQDQAADKHKIPVKEVFGPDYGESDATAEATSPPDDKPTAARPAGKNRKRPRKPKP